MSYRHEDSRRGEQTARERMRLEPELAVSMKVP
jgi:hypothetical protein